MSDDGKQVSIQTKEEEEAGGGGGSRLQVRNESRDQATLRGGSRVSFLLTRVIPVVAVKEAKKKRREGMRTND